MFDGLFSKIVDRFFSNATDIDKPLDFKEQVCLGDYPIYVSDGCQINPEIEQILFVLEPVSEQFRLGKSTITIVDNIALSNGISPNGITEGVPYLPHNQDVTVRSDSQHTLIHELGHVVDRTSDMQESIPWSRRSTFTHISNLYKNELEKYQTPSNAATINYLSSNAEIFAHLFEQYFCDRFSNIELGAETSDGLGGDVAKIVYDNPVVRKYFDDTLGFLHVNMFQQEIERLSENTKSLQ